MKSKLHTAAVARANHLAAERRDYSVSDTSAVAEINDIFWQQPYGKDTLHTHNCMEIGLCMEGHGTLIIGSGTEPLPFAAGTLFLCPANIPHSQQNEGPRARWRYIVLDERRLLREMPHNCRQTVSHMLDRLQKYGLYAHDNTLAADAAQYFSMIFEAQQKHTEPMYAYGEIEALLVLLLVRAAREPIPDIARPAVYPVELIAIQPALEHVSAFYQHEIRIETLASACAMSESYFRKIFSSLMGISPLEYINQYRIHRAMHLLHVTGAPIKTIAADCGFPSVATFMRNFNRHVGQSPSLWRKTVSFGKIPIKSDKKKMY